jgi:oligopeptidase B
MKFICSLFVIFILISCSDNISLMNPPKPEKIPFVLEKHGDVRTDYYYWLRDDSRSDQKIINYLKDENIYSDLWFENNVDYQSSILNELINQLPDKEVSFPVDNYGISYFSKSYDSKQLDVYFRKIDNKEEVVLDPNTKFETQDYYQAGRVNPNPINTIAAFSEDNDGRRKYIIKFINLVTKELISDVLQGTTGSVVWNNSGDTVYYLKKDPITLITNKVYKHVIGDTQDKDTLVYEEVDPEFSININKSTSKDFLMINIEKTNSNEIKIVDLNINKKNLYTFLPREENHLYRIDHVESYFYIRSNSNSPNYKIMVTESKSLTNINEAHEIISHNEDIYIQDFLITRDFLLLEIRTNGLPGIRTYDKTTLKHRDINFKDQSYYASLLSSRYAEYDKNIIHYYYSSLNTPPAIYSVDLLSDKSLKVWQKEIINFDESEYEIKRLFNEVRDGTMVPSTLVYKKGNDFKRPILFYGYGSYGNNTESSFRESLIPLLNRGFIIAYLNIRGGGEMGKYWYEEGRMLNKMNTFFDFNDSVKALLEKGYGDKNNVFARGGSAGGLLMGAIINLEPELYSGVISGVPFVDVLTTMSDPTIPLTTFEYDEWGNPDNYDEYFYMKKYSPYDNIESLNYPAVLVTSSLFDSQVQYFEPAKYVPKLREYSTSDNPILLKMNLIGGHGGKSGRINSFEERSLEASFLLNLVKKADQS